MPGGNSVKLKAAVAGGLAVISGAVGFVVTNFQCAGKTALGTALLFVLGSLLAFLTGHKAGQS